MAAERSGLERGFAVPAAGGLVGVTAGGEERGEGGEVALPGGELEGGEGVGEGVGIGGIGGGGNAGDGHGGLVGEREGGGRDGEVT